MGRDGGLDGDVGQLGDAAVSDTADVGDASAPPKTNMPAAAIETIAGDGGANLRLTSIAYRAGEPDDLFIVEIINEGSTIVCSPSFRASAHNSFGTELATASGRAFGTQYVLNGLPTAPCIAPRETSVAVGKPSSELPVPLVTRLVFTLTGTHGTTELSPYNPNLASVSVQESPPGTWSVWGTMQAVRTIAPRVWMFPRDAQGLLLRHSLALHR